MDQASVILPTVLHDTFYFCHFHSTACSKRCAFICHITVFLTTSRQQHPLYRTPFSFPLAPFRLLLPRPLPHLPNKDPTRNKASLFKGATASKVSPTFLFFPSPSFFLFPPGSVCAHQPVGLCCPVCLCLDRFMTLCGICLNKKRGRKTGEASVRRRWFLQEENAT